MSAVHYQNTLKMSSTLLNKIMSANEDKTNDIRQQNNKCTNKLRITENKTSTAGFHYSCDQIRHNFRFSAKNLK